MQNGFFYSQQSFCKMKPSKVWSKRQDNWKNYQYLFNQRKNLIFECQCGKKYLSYPGLYLHFQRKHNQKISTNFDQQLCKIVLHDEKTIYLYKLEEKQLKNRQLQKSETSEKQKSFLSNVLSKFVGESDQLLSTSKRLSRIQNKKELVQEIMENLQNFIQKIMEQKTDSHIEYKNQKQILSQIPNYLNEFMSQIKVINGSQEYWQICQVLIQMSSWLKRQGYTNLVVQMMEESPIEI